MIVEKTILEGCYVLTPTVYKDKRGYFFESFNHEKFKKATGVNIDFVQDNESYSTRGVLRGLHYQLGNNAQAKLVRVTQGNVLDIAIDIRPNSSTFGKHVSVELTAENKKQLFVPRGFAHGFIVLSEMAIFNYKCDNYYNKESEAGIIYNDPILNVDWKLPQNELIVSEKDLALPKLENARI